VLGVYADIVNEVVQDRCEIPARVEEVGPSRLVAHLGEDLVPGEDELPRVRRADERAGPVAEVVASPGHPDPRKLEDEPHDFDEDCHDPVRDGPHQVALIVQRVAYGLVPHQPDQVLRHVAEAAPANDAHVVGQMAFAPLERACAGLCRVRPWVALILLPTGDGASMLVYV
jgi:hypothetical protein